jgi:hypothetical protein
VRRENRATDLHGRCKTGKAGIIISSRLIERVHHLFHCLWDVGVFDAAYPIEFVVMPTHLRPTAEARAIRQPYKI